MTFDVQLYDGDELSSLLAQGVDDDCYVEHLELPLLDGDGNTAYLLAWMDGRPVGHLNLRWQGSRDRQVTAHVTDAAELSQISVWPARYRWRGIGTSLIGAAELAIRARGRTRVGLGVETSNIAAQRLYRRLGYQYWAHGVYLDRWVVAVAV